MTIPQTSPGLGSFTTKSQTCLPFCILNCCAHVVADCKSVKFIFSSHSCFLLVLFLGGCRQPVTRSSICSWTPLLFSYFQCWWPGLEGPALTLRQLRNLVHQPTRPLRSSLPPSSHPNVTMRAETGLFGQHLTSLSRFLTRKQKNV